MGVNIQPHAVFYQTLFCFWIAACDFGGGVPVTFLMPIRLRFIHLTLIQFNLQSYYNIYDSGNQGMEVGFLKKSLGFRFFTCKNSSVITIFFSIV